MTWPFRRSIVRQREQLLELRLADLQAQLTEQREQTAYFRTRYEKIADELLFTKGAIAAPVHVEPRGGAKENLTSRVMRVANLAGSATGVDFNRNKERGFGLPSLG